MLMVMFVIRFIIFIIFLLYSSHYSLKSELEALDRALRSGNLESDPFHSNSWMITWAGIQVCIGTTVTTSQAWGSEAVQPKVLLFYLKVWIIRQQPSPSRCCIQIAHNIYFFGTWAKQKNLQEIALGLRGTPRLTSLW